MDQQQNDRACNRPLGTAKRVSVVIYLFIFFFIRYCLICLTLRSNVPEGMSPFWRFWFVVVEKKKKNGSFMFRLYKERRDLNAWNRLLSIRTMKKRKGASGRYCRCAQCVYTVCPLLPQFQEGGSILMPFDLRVVFFFKRLFD